MTEAAAIIDSDEQLLARLAQRDLSDAERVLPDDDAEPDAADPPDPDPPWRSSA